MLYTSHQLKSISVDEYFIALDRYYHKFNNRRSEIKKLKTHENYFLFSNLMVKRSIDGQLEYDLHNIPEAHEYLFNKIILTHNNDLNFISQAYGPRGPLNRTDIEKNKIFFNEYYEKWVNQLKKKKGIYLQIVDTEINKRIKELNIKYDRGRIKKRDYLYQKKKYNALAFFIYYKVKLYFDEKADKYLLFIINGFNFIINPFTFIHILFRHYIPSMDVVNINRSINDDIPIIDTDNLPSSIKDIVINYFSQGAILNEQTEYILFSYDNKKYIIWIKYKIIDELNKNLGFEVRTFYNCKEARDLNKFENKKEIIIDNSLSFFI